MGRRVLTGVLFALITAAAAVPVSANARPGPKARAGFRLYARAISGLAVNRVSCGLQARGYICADTAGNGAGGFWPRGTIDQYVFASGLELAGIVGGTRTHSPWAGDTSGVFFFDASGQSSGDVVRQISNSADPDDLADWPAAARVPDESGPDNLYDPQLRGRDIASQEDVWWLAWDGDPANRAARPHPLGVLLETRGMGWNFPAGNEDILYFVFTIYNITSTNEADYTSVRPDMREILLERARDYQARVAARLGVTLPAGGYPIENLYVGFGADMDLGSTDVNNYASVNVPFSLGYIYRPTFDQPQGWSFDPSIFRPPFFAGTGFVGVKFLSSPPDASGQPVGLTTFSGYVNGGSGAAFSDPGNTSQLYRYLSARLDPGQGDDRCNTGDPTKTHICFVNYAQADDMRFFQSTGPLSLLPGHAGSVSVAYVFAAPVALSSCTPPCDVRPGDPTVLGDASRMQAGVNQIDSMTGFLDFTDANGDGTVEQKEFRVLPGSLLGKSLVAQAVFDAHFLLPNAPRQPDFFLVPGDGQVTVLWKAVEGPAAADPFFELAQSPTVLPPGGSDQVDNPLYDPAYRRFDVEGYRIYRGRVNSPESFTLLAQFDYTGTVLSDYGGQVSPDPGCAPELGITLSCPGQFDPVLPGVARTRKVDHPLVGPIVQVRFGGRTTAANGTALLLDADTALTGGPRPFPPLRDTGVPFVYVDHSVRNNLRYFYVVTAFDLNSLVSGPSSLESTRAVTKQVIPTVPATNYASLAEIRTTLLGRGEPLDTGAPMPVLDPETGRFSGPFPPANDFRVSLAQLVPTLLSGTGSFSFRLDSLRLGSAFEHGAGRAGEPVVYYLSTGLPGATINLQLPIVPGQVSGRAVDSTFIRAVPVDADQAQRFGVSGEFWLTAQLSLGLEGAGYGGGWGAGCASGAPGFAIEGTTGCEYNGARWFDGPSPQANETRDHPQDSHPANAARPGPMADLGNAGALSGVATIQMPQAYATVESTFHVVEGVLGGAWRAADFNLFWGDGGLIDSVIDATHHVAVPFDSLRLAGSWGVLNQSNTAAPGSFDARPGVLTLADVTCVEPLRASEMVQESYPCAAPEAYQLSRTAAPGPVAVFDQTLNRARTAPVRPGAGFALYLAGSLSIFELSGALPPAGTVWTLRTYVGAISGGVGAAGDRGPYRFTARPRPLTATGVELRVDFDVVNLTAGSTQADLRRVHTVPDPYYVSSKYETGAGKALQFVNLPDQAIIRIYSSSGVLVALLEHRSGTYGGSEQWNLLSRNNQVVASGVYFYHIEAGDARRVGRFTVINVAE